MENMEEKKELSPAMKDMIADIKEGGELFQPPARYYFNNRQDYKKTDPK